MPGADPLENVLVYYETAGFPHTSRDEGLAAIQALGAANDFTVDRERGLRRLHGRQPRPVRRRGLPLHHRRRPDRRAAGSVRGLLPRRRRLRRHPLGRRHRVRRGVVRRDDRRLLPQPPGRNPPRDRQHQRPRRAFHRGPSDQLGADGRVVQLPISRNPVVNGGGDDYSSRNSGVKVLATVDESTYAEEDGSTARTTTTRSRGARTSTAAACGTRGWATPRSRSAPARATSARTSSAASRR